MGRKYKLKICDKESFLWIQTDLIRAVDEGSELM
jgi:hypothetical protein